MNATVLSPGVSSRTTTLQGLPNRALFLDRLKQALASAQRHGQRVALLFLDLDRFKEINDTQGHAIGDRALIEIARRFQAALREEETLARLAGDEFVVIAMGANQSAAALIAERIQKKRSPNLSQSMDGFLRSRQVSALLSIQKMDARPRSCSNTPTSPCTGPRPAAGAIASTVRRWVRIWRGSWKSSIAWKPRLPPDGCNSTIIPRCICPAAKS
ncbi:GGDEF domain-containing protein [Aquabacterium sp. G14]|uniref:diguanylate cyclase domain-containing protein n=1 Tax=Aquabacterium sp. G14 TaxID=3130164 RepID=UPI001470ECFD